MFLIQEFSARSDESVRRFVQDLADHDFAKAIADGVPEDTAWDDCLVVKCRALPMVCLGKGRGVMESIPVLSQNHRKIIGRTVGLMTHRRFFCEFHGLDNGPGSRGHSAFVNKLDALMFVLLLETGCGEKPLDDLAHYCEMVVSTVSDQGLCASTLLF